MLVTLVNLERRLVGEIFATNLASLLDTMSEEMAIQALLVLQRFSTDNAKKGPGIGMRSHMVP